MFSLLQVTGYFCVVFFFSCVHLWCHKIILLQMRGVVDIILILIYIPFIKSHFCCRYYSSNYCDAKKCKYIQCVKRWVYGMRNRGVLGVERIILLEALVKIRSFNFTSYKPVWTLHTLAQNFCLVSQTLLYLNDVHLVEKWYLHNCVLNFDSTNMSPKI
jgi:hypothetical protein